MKNYKILTRPELQLQKETSQSLAVWFGKVFDDLTSEHFINQDFFGLVKISLVSHGKI